MSALSQRRCWQGLRPHHEHVKDLHLRELLAAEPELQHDSSTNALIRRYRAMR